MKKVLIFLKKLFAKARFYAELYVKPSTEVVQNIKTFMDSPALPILTAIIPGQIDDFIATRIKLVLPDVLKVLGYADQCINAKSGDAVLQCAIANLRLFNDTKKDVAYHNIASLLSHYLSDGKLSWSEAVHLAEMVHNETKQAA